MSRVVSSVRQRVRRGGLRRALFSAISTIMPACLWSGSAFILSGKDLEFGGSLQTVALIVLLAAPFWLVSFLPLVLLASERTLSISRLPLIGLGCGLAGGILLSFAFGLDFAPLVIGIGVVYGGLAGLTYPLLDAVIPERRTRA